MYFKNLKNKLLNKSFKVGVVGLGYVGLPLVKKFVKKKIKVFGYDKDLKKINKLKLGKNYLKNIRTDYFKKNKNQVSSNISILKKCNVIVICLPTPLKKNVPDMSIIFNFAKNLRSVIKRGQLIILESTVYPGATKELFVKINKNYSLGNDLFIGYSPERENPGDKKFSYQKTPKVISGYSSNCLKLVKYLYSHIVKKLHTAKNIRTAELSKLLENLYRASNIALINEFKIICDYLKIDVHEVIEAAASKNFGFQKFSPGPGWGGHCIPIDPFYLSWAAKKKGYESKIINEIGKINTSMPEFIIKKVISKLGKKINILLIGLSYKKNIDDDRESPTYEFVKILNKKKIKFDFYDPYFKAMKKTRRNSIIKKRVPLEIQNLKSYTCGIIITDHDNLNYKFFSDNLKFIFDTRGIYRKKKFIKKAEIINC